VELKAHWAIPSGGWLAIISKLSENPNSYNWHNETTILGGKMPGDAGI
jgi:hypothetical protein